MRDLRLVGVHEDGHHLLLSDGDGGRYRVPLDEPLRAAARRDRPRLGQLQIEMDGGMRPREVQALIRSGLSSEDVADRAGWSVEKVRRYEGPILAEREHVATLARQIRLRTRGGAGNETLGSRVNERLTGRGVDPSVALWDSSRTAEGQWTVTVLFPAGGRERSAAWHVDLVSRLVDPRDDEARWLSGDDTDDDGPIPAPHRVEPPVDAKVYDVDAEGGITGTPRRRRSGGDLVATMRETNSRRRKRNQPTLTPVADNAPEDALPLEEFGFDPAADAPPPPAGGTHPADEAGADEGTAVESAPAAPPAEEAKPQRRAKGRRAKKAATKEAAAPAAAEESEPKTAQLRAVPAAVDTEDSDDQVSDESGSDASSSDESASDEANTVANAEDSAGDSTIEDASAAAQPEVSAATETVASEDTEPETIEPEATDVNTTATDAAEQSAPEAEATQPEPAAPEAKEEPAPARPSARRGRTSVPSWDDIMFGAKGPGKD